MEQFKHIIWGCIERKPLYQKMAYEKYYGFALKTVFRYIYRYEKAADVVNDGFLKVFLHFDKFSGNADEEVEPLFMAWLKRIMINTAIDELRKTKLMPEIGGMPDFVWQETSNNHNADGNLLYKDIITMLKELPPLYRTIFNLYVIDGYSHQEISEILSISIGTSKSGLSRARVLLQASIKKTERKVDKQYVAS